MATKTKIYNQTADAIGDIDLAEKVFSAKINEALVHQAMVTQMANERQVLAHTKIRSEVRGGGKKPWRQKGTGRARAGSSRSPIWIGGGVTFGPRKDRNFSMKINRKMKQAALMMVFSDRAQNDGMAVIENINTEEFKTKNIDNMLKAFETKVFKTVEAKPAAKKGKKEEAAVKTKNAKRSFLLLDDASGEKVKYSSRNLAGVKLANINNINITDLLKYKNFIITKNAVAKLEERYNK